MQRDCQDKVDRDDRRPLETDCSPTIIAQTSYLEHGWVDKSCNVREQPFEIGKERRVVEGPFRGVLYKA